MGSVAVVSSGKGGTGKSTVAVGLAAAFASVGRKVLLIDMNIGARALDKLTVFDGNIVFDLSDVINKNVGLNSAVYSIDVDGNAYMLAAPLNYEEFNDESVENLILQASADYDRVIVDISPELLKKHREVFPYGSQLLFVSDCDVISLGLCNSLAGELGNDERFSLYIIFNRFNKKHISKYKLNIDMMIDISGLQLIGIIPEDKNLKKKYYKHEICKYGRSGPAFFRIAARLDGVDYPLPKIRRL